VLLHAQRAVPKTYGLELWMFGCALQKKKAAEEAVLRGDVKPEVHDKSVPMPQQGDLSMYTMVT
jgi:hypothetical protein